MVSNKVVSRGSVRLHFHALSLEIRYKSSEEVK